MWKLSIIVIMILLFNGCSYFKFNATMCENIVSDPTATIPPECIDYVEEDAQKAFENNKNSEEKSLNDTIEFNEK